MCVCMAAQVKDRVCGLSLLQPRLNSGPVCDDSAAEGGICQTDGRTDGQTVRPSVRLLDRV